MSSLNTIITPTYDPETVQPMRDELTATGFEELLSPDDVDRVFEENQKGTILLFINSVCGCAAGSARPGVNLSLQYHTIPDRLVTVFAGQEKEAVEYIRQKFLSDFMPSSPFIAIFKDGQLVHTIQRFEIEGAHPDEVAYRLEEVFDEHCSRKGPSIRPEQFEKIKKYRGSSSSIQRF